MKIISHSADADGKLSAYLVAKKFDIKNEKDFIMMDYGKGIDFLSKIKKGEKVVICDFSFENGPDDMKKLLEITDDVTWIDHHASAIEKYKNFGKDIKGLRVDGTAACMLTYIYFYIGEETIGKTFDKVTQEDCEKLYQYAPIVVRYVHDNDVWRHEYDGTEEFKLGLDCLNIQSPLDEKWDKLMTSRYVISNTLKMGEVCKKYRDSVSEIAINSGGFEFTIDGKHGYCMNMILGGSPWFLDKVKDYDFVCSFHYDGKNKQWKYNFYSDKERGCNCYKLAQFIDSKGGGHEHAAGCVSKKFIFN